MTSNRYFSAQNTPSPTVSPVVAPNVSYLNIRDYVNYKPPPNSRYTEKEHNDVLIDEIKLIENPVTEEDCGGQSADKLTPLLGNTDLGFLAFKSYANFFDPTVMRTLQCVFNGLKTEDNNSYLTNNIRFQLFLVELLRIGVESVEGVAISARFPYDNSFVTPTISKFGEYVPIKPFVLKAPRRAEWAKVNGARVDVALVHETFVGLVLNEMRDDGYLNFAYVYGGFKCGPPIFGALADGEMVDSKKTVSWCDRKGRVVNYSLYENVQPAISFAMYIKTCSLKEWLSIYLQTMYSLSAANRLFDFTHEDLHCDNLLVRSIQGTPVFCLAYVTGKTNDGAEETEYIVTNGVATIIDYGMSHVFVDGKHYGVTNREAYGILPKQSSIIADAWKLLGHSILWAIRHGRDDLANSLYYLVAYFTDEDPASFVQYSAGRYFSVTTGPKTDSFNLDDYITSTRNIFGFLLRDIIVETVPVGVPLINCQWFGGEPGICLSNEGEKPTSTELFYKKVFFTTPTAYSIVEFYDAYTILIAKAKKNDKVALAQAKKLYEEFDYDRAATLNNTLVRNLYLQFTSLLPQYVQRLNPIIPNSTSVQALVVLRQFVELLLWGYKLRELIELTVEISIAVATLYKVQYIYPISENRMNEYRRTVDLLNQGIDSARLVYLGAKSLPLGEPDSPSGKWFTNVMPRIAEALGITK